MKPFLDIKGREVEPGDEIMYVTRRGSNMQYNVTTVVALVEREFWNYQNTVLQTVLVCRNPHLRPEGHKRKSWEGPQPKTVTVGSTVVILEKKKND